jgi:hypothetical protein
MTRILLCLLSAAAFAAPAKKKAEASESSQRKMSFDSQVVEGEIYRPDYSVVTGEAPGEGWGVLRLRKNFADHAETDRQEKSR